MRPRAWPSKPVLIGLMLGLALLAALLVVYLATPPPDHVSSGCLWWTAKPVGQAAAGDRGCFRGYFAPGGGLFDSTDPSASGLHMDFAPSLNCTYRPRDPLVVRGEVVSGGGQTVILVDGCR